MALFKKDGSEGQRQQRKEQGGLVRMEPPPLLMRDPFQMMMRDPFQLMREMMIDPWRVFQRMSPWAEWAARGEGREMVWSPDFEVRETDDAIVIKGDIPGVKEQDIDVSVAGNNLQISGKREREEEAEEGTLYTYEREYGQFSRSFALPDSADLDKVRCDLKDGVLSVVVPKKPGSAPARRKVPIGGGTKA